MNIREGVFTTLIVLYIIIMLFVLYSFSSNKSWRLPKSSCPDFWVKTSNGECCNYHSKTKQCDTFDLSEESLCNTVKDIYKNGYDWDGITYGFGNSPPCAPF